MMRVHVAGLGLLAPGLDGWRESVPVLRGEAAWAPRPVAEPPRGHPAATALPAGERRRATLATKLALRVGLEALGEAGRGSGAAGPREPAPTCVLAPTCVFASGSGELSVMDAICRALLEPDRPVSPTQFHNSVHNAPAGYWSIATGSRAPSLSLSAHDGSFAAGLLEAAIVATADRRPVLLVAYDLPGPAPLDAARPLEGPFAAALLLSPEPSSGGSALLEIEMDLSGNAETTPPTALADPGLERLRQGNPAARSLPLLRALASGDARPVRLPAPDGAVLSVRVEGEVQGSTARVAASGEARVAASGEADFDEPDVRGADA